MSDYSDIFGREPEPWREPLGALRLTLTGPAESVDVERAQHEVEVLVRVLEAADAVVTVEMIAEALHGDECPDDPDEGESCGCDGNHYMRQGEIVLALLRGGEA